MAFDSTNHSPNTLTTTADICQEVYWSLIMIKQSQTTTICQFTFHAAKIGWWGFWTACSARDLDLENAVCPGESKLDNVNFANSVLWQRGAWGHLGIYMPRFPVGTILNHWHTSRAISHSPKRVQYPLLPRIIGIGTDRNIFRYGTDYS